MVRWYVVLDVDCSGLGDETAVPTLRHCPSSSFRQPNGVDEMANLRQHVPSHPAPRQRRRLPRVRAGRACAWKVIGRPMPRGYFRPCPEGRVVMLSNGAWQAADRYRRPDCINQRGDGMVKLKANGPGPSER